MSFRNPEICSKCGSKDQKISSEERSQYYPSFGYYVMTVDVKRCANCEEELWVSEKGKDVWCQ